jgi:hypothetical protein
MVLTMGRVSVIAASTTVQNVCTGERYERSPFDAIGNLYVTGSGAAATALLSELNIGGVSVTPPTNVNINNRMPLVPDDILVTEFEVAKGDLIQLSVTNTTAGALNFFWRIDLSPYQG